MCILCELIKDAGWGEMRDSELRMTAKGRQRVLETMQDAMGVDINDPAQVLRALGAISKMLDTEDADHDAMPSRDIIERVAMAAAQSSALQGKIQERVVAVPQSQGQQMQEQIAQQVEAAKLFGMAPPGLQVEGMDVMTADFEGRQYAWNLTMLRQWLLENQQRWELWHLRDTGLADYARVRLEQRAIDLDMLVQTTRDEAQRLPLVVAPAPAHLDEEPQPVILLDGMERLTRLLMSKIFEAQVVTLTAEESAQFMLLDGTD